MTLPGDDIVEAASAGAEDLVVGLEELGLQILPGSEPAVEGDVQGVYVRALAALPRRLIISFHNFLDSNHNFNYLILDNDIGLLNIVLQQSSPSPPPRHATRRVFVR